MTKRKSPEQIIDEFVEAWLHDKEADLRKYFCKVWNKAVEFMENIEQEEKGAGRMSLYEKKQELDFNDYVYPEKDVKEAIRKRNALIKDRIVKNDIYTADELFRLEDEVDEEIFGEELCSEKEVQE